MATIDLLEKVCVLNTNHICLPTRSRLTPSVGQTNIWGCVAVLEHGWMLRIPAKTTSDDNLPGDLRAAVVMARMKECGWLLIHDDGLRSPHLNWYHHD